MSRGCGSSGHSPAPPGFPLFRMMWEDAELPPPAAPPWEELAQAHRLLRRVARALDRIAVEAGGAGDVGEERWPVPFSPVRCVVLAHLASASAFGLTPTRLARLLEMRASSLAHHLDVLEEAGLIERRPRGLHDQRRVAVRLTAGGADALDRLEAALSPQGFSQ